MSDEVGSNLPGSILWRGKDFIQEWWYVTDLYPQEILHPRYKVRPLDFLLWLYRMGFNKDSFDPFSEFEDSDE